MLRSGPAVAVGSYSHWGGQSGAGELSAFLGLSFPTAQLLGYSEVEGLAGTAPSAVGLSILLPMAPWPQPHCPLLSPGLASGGTSLLLPQHFSSSAFLWQRRPVPSSAPDRPPGHIHPKCPLFAS